MKSVLRTMLAMLFFLAACGVESSVETVSSSSSNIISSVYDNDTEEAYALVRSTRHGEVKGTQSGDALVWYAIPYGAASVGERRWQEPQEPSNWNYPKLCVRPGKPSLQYEVDSTTGNMIAVGTEDCLNLDVYTTKNADNLPVLVYFHGGDNQTGTSLEIPGEQIVTRDHCVYVSVNYRLGLLGFNCLPALWQDGRTNNYALMDLAKALDWVKDNIAAFGGNPNNITVSGFSGGGCDVMAMLISPMFRGKFQKAIVFSGGMTLSDMDLSTEKTAELLASLAVEDDKAKDEKSAKEYLLGNNDEVREYLYGLDGDRLALAMGDASIRMSDFPHLFIDDIVIPYEGFMTEEYNDVPIIFVTGTTEFSFFNQSDDSFNKIKDEGLRDKAISFSDRYGSDMYRIFNTEMSAEQISFQYESNIYIAQIDFGSPTSKVSIPVYGSFHGIFIPMLSDHHGYTSIFDFAKHAGYQDMADKFNAYLANFLASGNPNGKGLTEWTPWTTDNKVSQVFDADDNLATIENKDVSTTYDEIMDAMDKDDTLDVKTKRYVIENTLNGRWFADALHDRYKTPDLWQTSQQSKR